MSYSVETSWHCVLCGKKLNKWGGKDSHEIEEFECTGCWAVFEAHDPYDIEKKHGDSFSLTYIH